MSGDCSHFPLKSCWLCAFLICVAASDVPMATPVDLIKPADSSQLAIESVWNLPLLVFTSLQRIVVPFWVFAGIVSFVSTYVAAQASERGQTVLACLLLIGVSFSLPPEHLFTATMIILLRKAIGWTSATSAWAGLATVILVSGAALCISLEFSIVVASGCIFLDAGLLHRDWRTRVSCVASILGLFAVFMLSAPAALGASLRPVDWLLCSGFISTFPQLGHALGQHGPLVGRLLLLLATLELVRMQFAWNRTSPDCLAGLVLAAIGIGCGWYTALAVVFLCMLTDMLEGNRMVRSHARPNVAERPLESQHVWWIPTTGFLTAFVLCGLQVCESGELNWLNSSSPTIVDVSRWQTSGPVMLTSSYHTRDWQSAELSTQFPLLLSDRWDAVTCDVAKQYAMACGDVRQGKEDRYLTEAGTLGGFGPFVDHHSPTLLVIDSHDFAAIRRMSVDRNWRIMSIDQRRTIFGRASVESTVVQSRRAIELLYHLEWPRMSFTGSLDGILGLETKSDRHAVASVLNAIRLPYAALKVLQNDEGFNATTTTRTWSYCELSHRVLRQTGRISLLDHPRAIRGLQDLQSSLLFAVNPLRNAVPLSSSALSDLKLVSVDRQATKRDLAVRSAFQLGAWDVAEREIEKLKITADQEFYRCFLRPDSPSDLLRNLTNVLQTHLSEIVREEALFYLGCLQLEIGDADSARQSFSESASVRADSPLASLRSLYLTQLMSRQ